MTVGGSLLEVTVSGRSFAVAADADAKLAIGGLIGRLETNGDGTSRLVQSRSNWSLTGVTLAIDFNRGDLEFLASLRDTAVAQGALTEGLGQALQLRAGATFSGASIIDVPVQITFINGESYGGVGLPMGKIEYSTMSATANVDFEGPGALEPS